MSSLSGGSESVLNLSLETIANIASRSPPSDVSTITPEALSGIQDALFEFLTSVSYESASNSLENNSTTISGDDVVSALRNLGFREYAEVMSVYLIKLKSSLPTFPSQTAPLVKAEAPIDVPVKADLETTKVQNSNKRKKAAKEIK